MELSANGFRVLALAYREFEPRAAYAKADESELILHGYVAFLDPPKETAARAIAAAQGHGVRIKVLTGDNELVTRKICHEVGLDAERIVLGGDVERMTDEQLGEAAEATAIFARLSPAHKRRVILALKGAGTWSAISATASTTPRPCAPPTWESPSTPPWTSPARPPTSSSSKKASWCSKTACSKGERSSPTSSST